VCGWGKGQLADTVADVDMVRAHTFTGTFETPKSLNFSLEYVKIACNTN